MTPRTTLCASALAPGSLRGPRLRRVVIGLAASLLAMGAGPAVQGAEPAHRAALASPEQLAAERMLLALLADPAVKAAQARLHHELLADPLARTPEGLATLDHAIAEWTAALAFEEISRDPAQPKLLWNVEDTPHTWFGHTINGSAVAGDNPDHIYRAGGVDGDGRYEITGWPNAHRPVQLTFQVTRSGIPGSKSQSANHSDLDNEVSSLNSNDMQIASDGSFTLTLDQTPANGRRNHLRMAPGPMTIVVRDVVSDWNQGPNRLEIRRLDKQPAGHVLTLAEIRAKLLENLPGYVRFWAGFKDSWYGGLKPNTFSGPELRGGGWAYIAGGRYDIAPDEVLVVTTTVAGAGYTGFQTINLWMIAADGRSHLTSLNTSQVAHNPDGGVTYVISPTDPGVANWIDTAGLHHGYVLLRWESLPKGGPKPEVRSFKVIKLAELSGPDYAGVPRVTPEQRREQLAQHAKGYANRLTQ
jgi:hypothetical protein